MLSRRDTLAALAASFAAPWLFAARAAASPLEYTLKPEKIDDGIWLVRGAQEAITQQNGGAIANIAILNSKAGAIIVDSGPSLKFGEALKALATELTGKPVVRVYITHFHPDHIFGNQAFDPKIVASSKGVVDGMAKVGEGFADGMYRLAGDWMRGTELVLPGTILERKPEDFGDRVIRPMPMGGHTDQDLVLFDKASGFIFAGDLVFLDRAPTTPHANLGKWRVSLSNLGGIPHRAIVPGHGPVEDNTRGLDQTLKWLDTIEKQVKTAFEKGLDITEAAALPLPEWTEKVALARYEYERTVMHLYPKFEASLWPRVDEKALQNTQPAQ